jgi:hypothetical protein
MAMAPQGNKQGVGGPGEGTGIIRGPDTGSALSGGGPGDAKERLGKGLNPDAQPDSISPHPGPGGSGTGVSGQPGLPRVWVSGGNTPTIPGYGRTGNEPGSPGRSATGKADDSFLFSIECSSRACGPFARYGQLPGDNYIFYMETAIGLAVMQYSDPASVSYPYAGRLTDPVPLRLDLPRHLAHARMVFKCDLDRTGALRYIQVLESGPQVVTSQVEAALQSWKFVPAKLGDQPIEVSALLGFNIDTR